MSTKKNTKSEKQSKKAAKTAKSDKAVETVADALVEAVETAEAVEPEVVPEVVAEVQEDQRKIRLQRIIEGALFSAHLPLSAQELVKLFSEEEKPSLGEVREILRMLQVHYEERGVALKEVASGFRFQVIDEVVPYLVHHLDEKPARYSRALLETLALIAYRQPITRGEIEDIRGVVVSTNIVQTLLEQEWIRIVGYKEVPGKPALYATTKTFLDHFGLKNLEELPPLAELKDFDALMMPTDAPAEQPAESLRLTVVTQETAPEEVIPEHITTETTETPECEPALAIAPEPEVAIVAEVE